MMPSTATKAKKPTIEDLERAVCLAKAALLRGEADVEELAEQLEDLEAQRAAVSVKKLGSRTEAVKRYEQLDRQKTKLERDLALTRVSISELEAEYEAAQDELEAAQDKQEEGHLKALAEAQYQACLKLEDLLEEMARARAEVLKAHQEHDAALRAAGHNPGWVDFREKVNRRVVKRLKLHNVNPVVAIVPVSPLARRSRDDG